ncbi:MAG: thioredoxin [Deinococcaceae bacterium]
MGKPMELSDATFTQAISQGYTLVDFWAPWCGPCRIIAPILEELVDDYAGRLTIGKLNIDENPKTASLYRVMSIPTLMLFKDGQLLDIIVGAQPKHIFVSKLNRHVPATIS